MREFVIALPVSSRVWKHTWMSRHFSNSRLDSTGVRQVAEGAPKGTVQRQGATHIAVTSSHLQCRAGINPCWSSPFMKGFFWGSRSSAIRDCGINPPDEGPELRVTSRSERASQISQNQTEVPASSLRNEINHILTVGCLLQSNYYQLTSGSQENVKLQEQGSKK